jgi:hypothetical protein
MVLFSLLYAAGAGQAQSPTSTPGLVPGDALMQKAFAQAAKQATTQKQKRATLASAAQAAVRKQFKTAFAGLSRGDAVSLVRQKFPGLLETPGAVALRSGESADAYLDNCTARIKGAAPDGGTALVPSPTPLRTKNADGKLAPVDVSLTETAGGWAPKNALEPYTVASSSDGGVRFTGGDLSVRPVGDAVSGVLEDSTVFYAATQADTDTIVKSLDNGVELYWQLRSKDSPEELARQR